MLTIILVVLIITIAISFHIKLRKRIALNEMQSIFMEMKFLLAKNNTTLNNKVIRHMTGYQNIITNPGLVDFQVYFTILKNTPKEKIDQLRKETEDIMLKMPNGFKDLTDKFNSHVDKMIFYSVFRFDFILFLGHLFIKSLFSWGIKEIGKIMKFIFKSDDEVNIINYARMQVC